MIEDFENNVFSLMKEYIKDILETYKIYQLKKYYTYCENEQNYYFKVNKEIERIINLMVKRFKLDLPEYLNMCLVLLDFRENKMNKCIIFGS